ncbi:hypothetical protein N7540_006165 [Penicillium herquei]|nr:hypothetical protein N7540_006165 [Penicillium herquei]
MHRFQNICFCGLLSCICGEHSESPSSSPEEERPLLPPWPERRPAPNGNHPPNPNRPRPDADDDALEPAPKRPKPNPEHESGPNSEPGPNLEPSPEPEPASNPDSGPNLEPASNIEPDPKSRSDPKPVPQLGRRNVVDDRDPVADRAWLQERGTQVVRWIDGPDLLDCPTLQYVPTLEQLEDFPNTVFTRVGSPEDAYGDYFSWASEPAHWLAWVIWFGMDSWSGMTANGVIVMANINRSLNAQSPFTSDVALGLYAHEFGTTETIRHIFFAGVVNTQTRSLVAQHLYEDQLGEDIRQWEYGTQGYLELMGTRIGRVAAYTVLSAFPRGTHRIYRIVTDFEPGVLSVEMRFDIQPISNNGVIDD